MVRSLRSLTASVRALRLLTASVRALRLLTMVPSFDVLDGRTARFRAFRPLARRCGFAVGVARGTLVR